MIVWLSIASALGYEIVDKRRWRVNMIRRDQADGNDILGRDDHGVSGHRHHRVEVARGQHVGEVTEIIGKESVDQREIRMQRCLD